jgi:mono/diheme cytochrome c family protein
MSKREEREAKMAEALGRRRFRTLLSGALVLLVLGALVFLWFLASQGSSPLASPDVINMGRSVYQENCAACHGAQGEGHVLLDSPALDETEHAWHHPDGQIQALLVSGGQNMPAFGDELTPSEIVAVIRFIQTWWTSDQLASQQENSRQMPLQ